MPMYLLRFGLKQRLFKVPDPPAAIEFTIPAVGVKFIFSSLGTYGSIFHGIYPMHHIAFANYC